MAAEYTFVMLSKETLDDYRRMTPGERLTLAFKLMRENTPSLLAGPPDVIDRRFALIQRENDLRNARFIESLQRLKSGSTGRT